MWKRLVRKFAITALVLYLSLPLIVLCGAMYVAGVRMPWFAPTFTPTAWRATKKMERLSLAEDFLQRNAVTTLTYDQLKSLLGKPDDENDVWCYYLSSKGAPPPGMQQMIVFTQHPQLYVHFCEGKVERVDSESNLELPKGTAFTSPAWASAPAASRMKMVADLIGRNVLIGRNKATVRRILGSPSEESEERRIYYDVGDDGIDPIELYFIVDARGRVTSGRIFYT